MPDTMAPALAALKPPKVPFWDDDIFFGKSRIVRGKTIFQNVGERERGSRWRVIAIQTHFTTDHPGVFDWKQSDYVRLLDDVLTLRNERTRAIRHVAFKVVKYSAIWRIV